MPTKFYRKRGIPEGDSPEAKEYKKWILENHKAIEKQYGIPEGGLLALTAHESHFDPLARSFTDALGAFQFTKTTARSYGLRIDDQVDERYDYKKSAHAAAKYLSENIKKYGDYYHAIAQYNSGGDAVTHLKSGKNPHDFVSKTADGKEFKQLGNFLKSVQERAEEFNYGSLFKQEKPKVMGNPYVPNKGITPQSVQVVDRGKKINGFFEDYQAKASGTKEQNQSPSLFFNPYTRRKVIMESAQALSAPVTQKSKASAVTSPAKATSFQEKAIAQGTDPIPVKKSIMELRPDLFRVYKEGGRIIQYSGDGKTVEAVLKGKERIYSRSDTKRLMDLSQSAKTENDFFLLGKFFYDATKKQDSRPPEYADA